MSIAPARRLTAYAPALVLALFAARLTGESVARYLAAPLHPATAVALTLILIALALLGQRRARTLLGWPAFLLLFYVFYPYPSWLAAGSALAAALWVWGITAVSRPLLPARWGGPALFFSLALLFLLLYGRTLAPDVLPADNGEFQLVAATLGVAHPTGFPLYTLLGHLATWLPWGATAAYRVNLLSALISAFTLFLVGSMAWQSGKSYWGGITAVLALGTATTFWAQATTANIRSLTTLFAALALYSLLQFRAATQARNQPAADRWLSAFVLALSLGLTHHVSLAFMGIIFLTFPFLIDAGLRRAPGRWWRPLAAGALGFLPWLYLPWRANSGAPGATPDLATLPGFLNHVLGLGFRGDFLYFTHPADLWPRLQVMGDVLTLQFSPWLLAGAAAGLLLLVWRDRPLAWLLGASFASHLFITATYRAPQTVEYMLPAYLLVALALGYGVGQLLAWRRWPLVAQTATAALLLTAVWQAIDRYPSFAALSAPHTRHTVQPLLAQTPPGGTLLADWHWATPLWYLQSVEGQRPDVTVEFVFPRSGSYGADWAERIAAELAAGRGVIATHYDAAAYADLPPPEPLYDAFYFPQEPRHTLPADYQPLDLLLGEAVHLAGYHLSRPAVPIGEELVLTLAWQPVAPLPTPLNLFAHLVAFDGRIMAQADVTAVATTNGLSLTQLRLTPRPGALPGEFALLLGAYGQEPLPTPAGENRALVGNVTVTAVAHPPYTAQPTNLARTDQPQHTLRGYDWDHTLPERPRLYLHWQTAVGFVTEVVDDPAGYAWPPLVGVWGMAPHQLPLAAAGRQIYLPLGQGVVWIGPELTPESLTPEPLTPGQSIWLRPRYAAGAPLLTDLVASLRLIGYEADGYHWAWWDLSDSVPALGAIPSLKWIAGTQVTDRHALRVSPEAEAGQTIGATLRLYDAFTGRPLPILDERITAELQLPWVPLGETAVR